MSWSRAVSVVRSMGSNFITNRNWVDKSLQRGYVDERASFTVPASTPEERVMAAAGKYQNNFGKYLEAKGFTVLHMTPPLLANDVIEPEPDRKKYFIYARAKRRPQEISIMVPDDAVNDMMNLGMKLTE
jgi:hypothetical protein